MIFTSEKIFRLIGRVQHYSWGGHSYIPEWLGIPNPGNLPFAEYWMGAHPLASSSLLTRNGELSLHRLISDNPAEMITEKVFREFGGLPYLFKILDVKEMLSIQVHPAKAAAGIGFDREEAEGILISSSNRNYKDRNHKPEVMVALSEFWLLHGFLKKEKLIKVLRETPEFENLLPIFLQHGYKGLYQHIMELPQDAVKEQLFPLVQRERERKQHSELDRHQPGWWVTRLYPHTAAPEEIDRGVFSIYFFNIVKVLPGEAIFQGAGLPHAYLEGQNVELMANSDNVLRGGLTPKHIDVTELLKHIVFEGIEPEILKGTELSPAEKKFLFPVPDFGISRLEILDGISYRSHTESLEMIAIMEGTLRLEGTNSIRLQKGEVACILPGESYQLIPESKVLAYKAFVPGNPCA